MEANGLNNPNINKEENSQQNASGNMYSYRDDNNNITNPQEAGAIRRSIGEGNPNINYAQNNIGGGYEQNYINNGNVGLQYSQEDYYNSNKKSLYWPTYLILGCIEGVIIVLLAVFLEKKIKFNYSEGEESSLNKNFNYGLLRDMNIMVFIGFGMLHSILVRSSWISISIHMLMLSYSIQSSLFFNFLWTICFKEEFKDETFDFKYLMKAIFISSSVLITLGSVLGKLSVIQYVILTIFETIFSTLNYRLCEVKLKTYDSGGSLYIHTFGAVFALAVSIVLFCSSKIKLEFQKYNNFNRSDYFSNLTSYLGIIILFCFFPTFNSALAEESLRERGRINTFLALFGSVMGSFITSGLLNGGRFIFEEIFLGSISGAIIISGCSTICLDHYVAIIIGTLGAIIFVIFLSKVKPFFEKWGLKDTCNVIILHGISGLLGAFITPMYIGGMEYRKVENFFNRKYRAQAGVQIGAIFITIGISFIGGISTGYLMKISTCGKISKYFTDAEFFKEEDNNIFELVQSNILYNDEINNPSLFKMDYPGYYNQRKKEPDIRGSQPSY